MLDRENSKPRQRRQDAASVSTLDGNDEDESSILQEVEAIEIAMRRQAHQCPVPKPKGLIGEVLGFKKEGSDENIPRPRIETERTPKTREDDP